MGCHLLLKRCLNDGPIMETLARRYRCVWPTPMEAASQCCDVKAFFAALIPPKSLIPGSIWRRHGSLGAAGHLGYLGVGWLATLTSGYLARGLEVSDLKLTPGTRRGAELNIPYGLMMRSWPPKMTSGRPQWTRALSDNHNTLAT